MYASNFQPTNLAGQSSKWEKKIHETPSNHPNEEDWNKQTYLHVSSGFSLPLSLYLFLAVALQDVSMFSFLGCVWNSPRRTGQMPPMYNHMLWDMDLADQSACLSRFLLKSAEEITKVFANCRQLTTLLEALPALVAARRWWKGKPFLGWFPPWMDQWLTGLYSELKLFVSSRMGEFLLSRFSAVDIWLFFKTLMRCTKWCETFWNPWMRKLNPCWPVQFSKMGLLWFLSLNISPGDFQLREICWSFKAISSTVNLTEPRSCPATQSCLDLEHLWRYATGEMVQQIYIYMYIYIWICCTMSCLVVGVCVFVCVLYVLSTVLYGSWTCASCNWGSPPCTCVQSLTNESTAKKLRQLSWLLGPTIYKDAHKTLAFDNQNMKRFFFCMLWLKETWNGDVCGLNFCAGTILLASLPAVWYSDIPLAAVIIPSR